MCLVDVKPYSINQSVREFGAPQQISTDFESWLRYCTDVAQRRSSKLCRMFGRLMGWYTIHTFWGLLPPNGILPAAKFTLCLSLAFSYIHWQRYCTALEQRHQPHFVTWYKEWNYGTFSVDATILWHTRAVHVLPVQCRRRACRVRTTTVS